MPFITGKELQHLELWIMLKSDMSHNGFVWQPGWNTYPLTEDHKKGIWFTTIDKIFELVCDHDEGAVVKMIIGRVYVHPQEVVWKHEAHDWWTAGRAKLGKTKLVEQLSDRQFYMMLNGNYLNGVLPPYRAAESEEQMNELLDMLARRSTRSMNDLESLSMTLFLRSGYSTMSFMRFREYRELAYYYGALNQILGHLASRRRDWCIRIVSIHGFLISLVKEQFLEACLAVVKHDPKDIKYIEPQFQDACRDYVNNNK